MARWEERSVKWTDVDYALLAVCSARMTLLSGFTSVPMLGLFVGFREMQKLYATVGASFMPLLALGLLLMKGRRAWVGDAANKAPTVLLLVTALLFFALLGRLGLGD